MDPIIVTLQFDAETAACFERQRQAHAPPALRRIPAHLTLFHALPGDREDAVRGAVGRAAARPAFPVRIDGLMPLGRGVAYSVSAAALHELRRELAVTFGPWLRGQDRERFRPHVTIQNTVSTAQARRTLTVLAEAFVPFAGEAQGLQLWRYRGGPWQPLGAVAFAG